MMSVKNTLANLLANTLSSTKLILNKFGKFLHILAWVLICKEIA